MKNSRIDQSIDSELFYFTSTRDFVNLYSLILKKLKNFKTANIFEKYFELC